MIGAVVDSRCVKALSGTSFGRGQRPSPMAGGAPPNAESLAVTAWTVVVAAAVALAAAAAFVGPND